jgi:hypothetical protein
LLGAGFVAKSNTSLPTVVVVREAQIAAIHPAPHLPVSHQQLAAVLPLDAEGATWVHMRPATVAAVQPRKALGSDTRLVVRRPVMGMRRRGYRRSRRGSQQRGEQGKEQSARHGKTPLGRAWQPETELRHYSVLQRTSILRMLARARSVRLSLISLGRATVGCRFATPFRWTRNPGSVEQGGVHAYRNAQGRQSRCRARPTSERLTRSRSAAPWVPRDLRCQRARGRLAPARLAVPARVESTVTAKRRAKSSLGQAGRG